ncbi:Rne/Rng family ribonuclease [Terriglobus aquaticus]|uniref:Rne/Rng family ribonuclease n=1 Tax=Terriglobus aquaticus TaxID=940139 RepID=A0ABW9KKP2_9BACT|nr:Rne/Rng family ribonuclease [Terriglobus aquaticus]
MSKEIYISTTPHETRLAIVEDEQLSEIYYERENEYTLAGSIYNGKVTRVLPGMQSSFVDIGLERDAFLYVTDFMEEQGDAADFESENGGSRRGQPREAGSRDEGRREEGRREEGSRGARDRGRRGRRDATEPTQETTSFDEPIAPAPVDESANYDNQAALDEQGSRRWRGRRGRRRGRGGREGGSSDASTGGFPEQGDVRSDLSGETIVLEGSSDDEVEFDSGVSADGTITIDLEGAAEPENLGRRNVHRPGRVGRPGSDERAARQNQPEEREPRQRDDRGRDRRSFGSRDREEDFVPAGAAVTTLPGESIRKYRDPAEVAAEDAARQAAAPRAPEPLVAAQPSIEIVGWNGGATLPGESISRYQRSERSSRSKSVAAAPSTMDQAEDAPAETPEVVAAAPESSEDALEMAAPTTAGSAEVVTEEVAPSPIPDQQSDVAAAAAPDETGGLTQHPAHADESAAVSPQVVDNAHAAVEAAEENAPVPDAGEYEPAEGTAARLSETDRRDLRRRTRRSEAVAAETGADSASGEPTAEDVSADTHTVSGEEHETRVEESAGLISLFGSAGVPGPVDHTITQESEAPTASEAAVDQEVVTAPELESAAGSATATEIGPEQDAEIVSGEAAEPAAHEFTSIQPDGVMLTEPLQDKADAEPEQQEELATPFDAHAYDETELSVAELSGAEPVPQVHAYGEGDFHEEELDGDEYEFDTAFAAIEEDDFDEYEEETLDEATEQHADGLDQHGDERSLLSGDEDEDELEASPDTGGFTVDDFGGEPDEDAAEETTGSAPAQGGERRGRRDNRRGGRDRDRGVRGERPFRGGAGADRGRGRSRQSVQTMDLPAITDLLKPGQEVLVQIAKEPIAKKGARITSHIALPGRFLVFMPTVNHTGVSRKISSDEERRRLKSILLSEKGEHQGGFIVRTAAEGATEEELRNDLRFLIQLWQDIKMRSETSKSPALIYHDLGLIERILRDQVTDNFSAIWVDSEQEYERVLRFLQRFQPSLVRRVKLYTKETPLFEHFGITQEIDRALKSKVWLKSGGSIVINQTEALVAIDINTGKYVGKTARLEDTILKTNLDAIPEIVRQIRLRDLGGIIVIDFIDMDERKNRAKVMQALEDELKTDRAPSKVLPFNDFGLVIMTRKRVKQSLERTLCIPDPVTEGTGMIKSPVTVANEIYVEVRKMYRHIEKPDMMLRVHPEVVKQLKQNGARRLQELEEMTHKTILLKSDPSLSPEQFDIH